MAGVVSSSRVDGGKCAGVQVSGGSFYVINGQIPERLGAQKSSDCGPKVSRLRRLILPGCGEHPAPVFHKGPFSIPDRAFAPKFPKTWFPARLAGG
jgi:hypothetical protein